MVASSNIKKVSKTNEANRFVTPLVTGVSYVERYVLRITFSDKTVKDIDFETYLGSASVFKPFLDVRKFKKFRLDYGDLTWPGNILDFHHSTLYNWK